jgi:hypothetical protein
MNPTNPTTASRSPHALFAALLLAACGGGADDALAQDIPRDACELIPATVVAEMAGAEVEVKDLGRSPAISWSACAWLDVPVDPEFPSPALEIQVTWAGGAAKAKEEVESGADQLIPVNGLGDGAWVSTYVGTRSLLVVRDAGATGARAVVSGTATRPERPRGGP